MSGPPGGANTIVIHAASEAIDNQLYYKVMQRSGNTHAAARGKRASLTTDRRSI